MTITAILPAHNREIQIGTLVLKTKKHVDHVLVIDNGSTDRTGEMAQLAGAEVIRNPRNMGTGAAIKSGFEYVGRNGAKVIVTMDLDGDQNLEDIPRLIGPILKGEADVVSGEWRMDVNTGLSTSKIHGSIQAFARHTLPAFRFKSNGKTTGKDMLIEAVNAGLRVKEVEMGVKKSANYTHEKHESHILKTLIKIFEDIELSEPLYYLIIPGLVCTIIGMGLGLNILNDFIMGEVLKFWPMFFMIVMTISGVFMTFTGIILHSVTRLISEKDKMNNPKPRRNPKAIR